MHQNRALQEVLAAFVQEAADLLTNKLAAGEEIPFELIDGGRSSSPLYCYRPLTGRFLSENAKALMNLPAASTAIAQLATLPNCRRYLQVRGWPQTARGPHQLAQACLQALLAHLWGDASEFSLDDTRFDNAYCELERQLYEGASVATVITPIEGVWIESAEIELNNEIRLLSPGQLQSLPHDIRCEQLPLAVLQLENPGSESDALQLAGQRLRRLQTALRLWDEAEPTLGPAAWVKSDSGPWVLVPLPTGVRHSADTCLLRQCDEASLRAFCTVVASRTPRVGELAWALRRFELGCERPLLAESVTDWLLCARALLDDPQNPNNGLFCDRIAAICSPASARHAVAERILELVTLERSLVAGLIACDGGVDELIADLGNYLRAMLRDVLSGHLQPNLRELADSLLAAPLAA